METVIYQNGIRYTEKQYELETDFERLVFDNSKTLFGENAIFVDAKKKMITIFLGELFLMAFYQISPIKTFQNFILLKLNW